MVTLVQVRRDDEFDIRRLLEHYMRYDDDLDLSGMLTVFESDAVYRVMGGEHVGLSAIEKFLRDHGMTKDRPSWRDPGRLMDPPLRTHISSNPVIEFVDDDTAAVESDFTVIERDENGHALVVLAGRYRDVVARQADGRWLFRDRTGVSMQRRSAKFFGTALGAS
ncbi:nuclear transport factor 2 family protein [Mycolicibacterium hodleri]|uniref:Nuclear transport factor 2 family protein n=1 Tax=Mycolicibacterium hodleri TaxID=49897 RepID=A0A502EGQ6_9MYCO|nr:nuclear transport factor 2 family protein [Mycolicibacterium hodleri]TPG36637.1 nuclear transport factor 2 family protein [Mycolicibacterium hodleri]